MTQFTCLSVARLALLWVAAATACAHAANSDASSVDRGIGHARESVRQDARIAALESKLCAVEARLQTLQAQARAQRDHVQSQRQLTIERWQPASLEQLTHPEERSIEGRGDGVKLLVQRSRKDKP